MADYKVTDTQLTNIANAIRTKGGTSEQLEFPTEFISAVNAISGVTAADEGKVVSNGVLVAQQSGTATTNGTVDTTIINSLSVNVPQTVVMPISLTVTPPTKTEYEKGDTLDLTGIAVVANYSDGTTAVVTGSCTFSPDDGDTLDTSGDVTITATYNGTGPVSGGSYSVQLTGTTSVHVNAGLEIVPWSTGTDEQIVAMLEAAHNGDIDLQTDGGWAVGNARRINIGSFVDGAGTTHNSQQIDIVISQFGNYNSCGCIMQFDFKQCLAQKVRAATTTSINGGYGDSELYSTTIPALVNALPSWLKDSLITFSAYCSGYTARTVPNNKLALRTSKEIVNNQNYTPDTVTTQIDYYKTADNRKKLCGLNGSTCTYYTRTGDYGSNRLLTIYTSGTVDNSEATNKLLGLAPFGCL